MLGGTFLEIEPDGFLRELVVRIRNHHNCTLQVQQKVFDMFWNFGFTVTSVLATLKQTFMESMKIHVRDEATQPNLTHNFLIWFDVFWQQTIPLT